MSLRFHWSTGCGRAGVSWRRFLTATRRARCVPAGRLDGGGCDRRHGSARSISTPHPSIHPSIHPSNHSLIHPSGAAFPFSVVGDILCSRGVPNEWVVTPGRGSFGLPRFGGRQVGSRPTWPGTHPLPCLYRVFFFTNRCCCFFAVGCWSSVFF